MTQRARPSWQRIAGVSLLAIACATTIFIGVPPQWDVQVTTWFQRAAPLPDILAAIYTTLGNAELMVLAAGVAGGLWVLRRRPQGVPTLWLAGGLAVVSVIAVGLKFVLPHPGPPLALQRHVLEFGLSAATPGSFPSGHTMRITFFAVTTLRRWPIIGATVVGAMMAGLIYLGDHWLSDVLGGLILGWMCASLMDAIKPV